MTKKLIIGLSLALVLVSGSFFNAQADCGCLPQVSSCYSCGARDMDSVQARDLDRSDATCQGAYNYGPATPEPMGAPGAY